MEPMTFGHFLLRCLLRAAIDSAEIFELKVRSAVIAVVLVVLGFGLHYLVRGVAETKDEAYKWAVLVAAPTVLFLAGLFLFNCFRAPYLVYVAEYGKAQRELKQAKDARSQADARVAELEREIKERSKIARDEGGPRPHVIDKLGPINGRVFYQDEAGNLNFPDPLSIRNDGDLSTQQVSVHVYFSEVVALSVRQFWESTGTGDDRFPFELWVRANLQLSPGETWKIPTLQGKRANIEWVKPIVVKMEVFYGAPKPEVVVFRIEKH
jgi:hypothetical protein